MAEGDRLLRDFLESASEPESERHLTALLDTIARPIARRVVSSVFRHSQAADVEDVVSDTLIHLLRHLRELRVDRSSKIVDFSGYVATCAYHRCHQRLHEKYPARNRLRNHLRYLLGHDGGLALWHVSDGRMVGGLRAWEGQQPAPSDSTADLRLTARADRTAEDRVQTALLVSQIFRITGRPLELDQLVNVVARTIGLDEERTVAADDIRENAAAADVDVRLSLRELWEDVAILSQRQRAALLLNLRDASGVEVLSLVVDTRTATISEIATALEMPVAQLSEIWNDLPLSDAVIARMLAVSPQQVIKFRRLARERLRRLAKRREQPPPIPAPFVVPRVARRAGGAE